MRGYWNDPELTAEVLDDDGWLRSGDLGVLDADGNLVLVGRVGDMYIRGGYNVLSRSRWRTCSPSTPGRPGRGGRASPRRYRRDRGGLRRPGDGAAPPTLEELRAWCAAGWPTTRRPTRSIVDALPLTRDAQAGPGRTGRTDRVARQGYSTSATRHQSAPISGLIGRRSTNSPSASAHRTSPCLAPPAGAVCVLLADEPARYRSSRPTGVMIGNRCADRRFARASDLRRWRTTEHLSNRRGWRHRGRPPAAEEVPAKRNRAAYAPIIALDRNEVGGHGLSAARKVEPPSEDLLPSETAAGASRADQSFRDSVNSTGVAVSGAAAATSSSKVRSAVIMSAYSVPPPGLRTVGSCQVRIGGKPPRSVIRQD